MKVRNRVLLSASILLSAGMYWLVDWIVYDARLHYFITMEESLVDTSTVLAAQIAQSSQSGDVQVSPAFSNAFHAAAEQRLSAKIYDLAKTNMNLRVVVIDDESLTVFDSRGDLQRGELYQWRDSRLTLAGKYGARASNEIPGETESLHFYVAAPIIVHGEIIGAISVGKPMRSIRPFIIQARNRLIISGVIGVVGILLLLVPVSLWIIYPIKALTRYARNIRDGKKTERPRLGHGGEMSALADAFEEMRDALEGKKYVEEYVQSLTHEMKSPLAAIQGASELLHEEMPESQRQRFLSNIESESNRLHALVERMLSLAAIEKKKDLSGREPIDIHMLIADLSDSLHPLLCANDLTLNTSIDENTVLAGEYFLLRQAIANLIQNAIDFSPAQSAIDLNVQTSEKITSITISDNGPGLPDYAHDKIFDRFYSLPRPNDGKKSSGLGLNFVREIARLHGGTVTLQNHEKSGALATLKIPSA